MKIMLTQNTGTYQNEDKYIKKYNFFFPFEKSS